MTNFFVTWITLHAYKLTSTATEKWKFQHEREWFWLMKVYIPFFCGAMSSWGTFFLAHRNLLATISVLVAVLYHGTVAPGPDDSCTRLLTAGSFVSGETWQPDGCRMHNYTTQDARQCMKIAATTNKIETRIDIIGDSRLRYIYNRICKMLQSDVWIKKEDHKVLKDHIHDLEDELGLIMEYHSRILINEDHVVELMKIFKRRPPSLVVLGDMLHYLVKYGLNESSNGLADYTDGLTRLVKDVHQLDPQVPVVYKLTEPYSLQHQKSNINPIRRNELIKMYNKAAETILAGTRITPWYSALAVAEARMADYKDGTHAGEKTDMYFIQMLLNLYCNQHFPGLHPDTCCQHNTAGRGTLTVQIVAATVCCLSILVVFLLIFRNRMYSSSGEKVSTVSTDHEGVSVEVNGPLLPTEVDQYSNADGDHSNKFATDTNQNFQRISSSGSNSSLEKANVRQKNDPDFNSFIDGQSNKFQIVWSLLKLSCILTYFVLCDRVSWFQTSDKNYSLFAFGLPLAVALLVAIFTARKISNSDCDESLLNKSITDEWKGWMQLVIVVYYLSGVSEILPIYLLVRALVSAYLFITGYGHFTRYWNTGEAGGIVRYCQVMFQLNFLTVLLCLVMNQPYMNYYFISLVSFWFTALHAVLSLPPRLVGRGPDRPGADYGRGALKIALLAALVASLALSERLFTALFGSWPLAPVFHQHAEAGLEEWRSRWMLDRFSVLYGMTFALAVRAWTQLRSGNTPDNDCLGSKMRTMIVGLTSSLCVCSYFFLPRLCQEKELCNALHPYVTWIPILGYTFLRNNCRLLRQHFSPLFAWMGRLSLELYVSQYHILRVATTQQVLILVPGPLNFPVTGFVFLCVVLELNLITGTLQRVLVPSDLRRIAVNLVIVLLVVVVSMSERLQMIAL